MNDDGSRIVVVSASPNSSYTKTVVLVYEYNAKGDVWEQLGDAIENTQVDPEYSCSATISMNGAGDRIVVGFPINGNKRSSYFYYYDSNIFAYEFDENRKVWIQLGGQIDHVQSGLGLGFVARFSKDGTRIAIGAQGSTSVSYYYPFKAYLQVFEYDNERNDWKEIGQHICSDEDETYAGSLNGKSLSLNADGSKIIVGAQFHVKRKEHRANDDSPDGVGRIKVYKYEKESEGAYLEIE
ncbi:hypothetical protein CTEN210_18030 [Chaetoceros tenuissimus]|uniref:Uncharacterized protein n=1 Tax=Chaetoceros tenuissimus TaxID=426638 RepID=A0AAD3DBS7_9STRA|nr:hypothetical protein CTEN210_18030 [Chaetoceros tenuissimus]